MADGFRLALLRHINILAQEATPQTKLDPQGAINLLQSQNKPEALRLNNRAGHKDTITVKYLPRAVEEQVDSAYSCDQVNLNTYLEHDVDVTFRSQYAFQIDDETIARYEDEASRVVSIGNPTTGVLGEIFTQIQTGANAMMNAVASQLWPLMTAAIGENIVTGLVGAKVVNLPLDSTQNNLGAGETEVLSDYRLNGGNGRPQIVGDGNIFKYFLQQVAKSPNQAGINTRIFASGMDFYHDTKATTELGANQAIVYQPNSVQIVEYLENTGFKAGDKPDGSSFFVLALPMDRGDGEVVPVEFDVQVRYNSCPETLTDAYYGTSISAEKGWTVFLRKRGGLFTIPGDAYKPQDRLRNNRGSLRYDFTNV